QCAQKRTEGDRAERDEDARTFQESDLALHIFAAVVELRRQRLVAGGRAAARCRNERAMELQSVPGTLRDRLVGQADRMERRVEDVSRPIARERAPGAIASMGRGRQSDDREAACRIPEARNGPRPVLLTGVAARRMARHLLSPPDQTRASP